RTLCLKRFRLILELSFFHGRFHDRFHATVLSAAFASAVVSNRFGFAVTFSGDAVAVHVEVVNQHVLHGVGTLLGQFLVVAFRTGAVGVTFQNQVRGRVLAHAGSQAFQLGVGGLTNNRLVELELHVQGFFNVFGQVELAAHLVDFRAGRGVRALVSAVRYAVTIVVQLTTAGIDYRAGRSVRALITIIRNTVAVAVGGHVGYRSRLGSAGSADQQVQAGVDLAIPTLAAEAVGRACAYVQQEVASQRGLHTEFNTTNGFLEIVVA